MSAWTQVKAVLPRRPDDWSIFHDAFENHGLLGTVQTDEPPTISAYLAPGDELKLDALSAELVRRGAASVETALVEEEDWLNSWKQFFKPRRVGRSFVIRPTWEPYELLPGDREIVLDPGQAFGTGEHPTTRMCLALLEGLAGSLPPGWTAADIGCGSGVLSVAAGKLGASQVKAVDLDTPAVEATRENARLNGVEVQVFAGRGFDPLDTGAYDVVLANLISAVLITLAPEAAKRVKPGGYWIISGVIDSNWPDVRAAADRAGFQLDRDEQEGDWVAAVFSLKST